MSTEHVLSRYSQGAEAVEADLCCPVEYDRSLLKLLPDEIVERDYGCGDPSRYVRAGDTVLDLGAGGGKICYMAAQLVGENGRVIGVDMNDDMLALARRHQATMAERLGGDRVAFHKGRIQDLALDLAATDAWLADYPVRGSADLLALEAHQERQRRETPLIPDGSVDLVVSNCVLNLVAERDRWHMIAEIFRVLKPGGRVAISDIVSSAPVPERLKRDPDLWSGCISGAFHEADFAAAFAEAGFAGMTYDKWQVEPWRVVEDIVFRSVTLTAQRPETDGADSDGGSVIYRGPFAAVEDDAGRRFARGRRVPVSAAAYADCVHGAAAGQFIGIDVAGHGEIAEPWAPSEEAPSGGGCC